MQAAQRGSKLARIREVGFDRDGVLNDDVTGAFRGLGFLRRGGLAEELYAEGIFALLNLAPHHSASRLRDTAVDQKALEAVAYVRGRGIRTRVCTANPIVDKERIEENLRMYGISTRVEKMSNSKKAAEFGYGAILIEDNPWVALRSAGAGADVILIAKKYNHATRWVFSMVNARVHIVANMEGASAKIAELIAERGYSPMVRKESDIGAVPSTAEA